MKIKVIAETAWHHDGDFTFFNSLIDQLIINSKADVIKLHLTLDLDEYMDSAHSAYDFLKNRLLNKKQWRIIIEKIEKSDKELMLLFNDLQAIEFGMQFNPSLIEIHSVCLSDVHLLTKLKEYNTNKIPVILGIGGSTLYEIEKAINFLETNNIVLMHGFQNYPTKYEDVNFNKIKKIQNLYPKFAHGYADHTSWDEPNNELITLMGASLGMEYIEKHVTLFPGQKKTDWQAAIEIDKFNSIVEKIRILEKCQGNGSLLLNKGEQDYSVFGPNKKVALLKNGIKAGEKLQLSNVVFKRVVQIVEKNKSDVSDVLGKRALTDLNKNSLIDIKDFE